MEPLDKLIPLAILGLVGAFLVYLVRRAAREPDAAPRTDALPAIVDSETNAAPEIVDNVITATLAVPEPQSSPAVATKKRKKAPPAVVATPVVQTPIVNVLDLLKKKDSLATAFLLREILAPPVSKR